MKGNALCSIGRVIWFATITLATVATSRAQENSQALVFDVSPSGLERTADADRLRRLVMVRDFPFRSICIGCGPASGLRRLPSIRLPC